MEVGLVSSERLAMIPNNVMATCTLKTYLTG